MNITFFQKNVKLTSIKYKQKTKLNIIFKSNQFFYILAKISSFPMMLKLELLWFKTSNVSIAFFQSFASELFLFFSANMLSRFFF